MSTGSNPYNKDPPCNNWALWNQMGNAQEQYQKALEAKKIEFYNIKKMNWFTHKQNISKSAK